MSLITPDPDRGQSRRRHPIAGIGTIHLSPVLERVSDWEKVLYTALVDAGLRTVPQYNVDQYDLDLALIRPNGRRLDIEVDGERYHRDWDGELIRRDQLRNLRLIETGWDVLRLWVYEIRDSLPACVARVAAWAAAADALPSVLSAEPSSVRSHHRATT